MRLFTALSSIKLHPFCLPALLPLQSSHGARDACAPPFTLFAIKCFLRIHLSSRSISCAHHSPFVFLFSACECVRTKDYLICSPKEMSKDKNKIDASFLRSSTYTLSLFLSSVAGVTEFRHILGMAYFERHFGTRMKSF